MTSPLYAKDSAGRLDVTRVEGRQEFAQPPARKVHDALLDAFLAMIRSGGPCPAPAEDALHGMEMIAQAYAAGPTRQGLALESQRIR